MHASLSVKMVTMQGGHTLHCFCSVCVFNTWTDDNRSIRLRRCLHKNIYRKILIVKSCAYSNLHFFLILLLLLLNQRVVSSTNVKVLEKFENYSHLIESILNSWWSTGHDNTSALMLLNPDLKSLSVCPTKEDWISICFMEVSNLKPCHMCAVNATE